MIILFTMPDPLNVFRILLKTTLETGKKINFTNSLCLEQKNGPESFPPGPDLYPNKSIFLNGTSTALTGAYPDALFERSNKYFTIAHRPIGAVSPGGV